MNPGSTPPPKLLRSQKLVLSARGADAANAYRESIAASRAEGGRASFDRACQNWAQAHAMQVDDALYLQEIAQAQAGATLDQIAAALESCGKTRTDAQKAIKRLVAEGVLLFAPPPQLT